MGRGVGAGYRNQEDGGGMTKVNLGCGEFYQVGWVNIDLGERNRVDIVADITKGLPFEDGTIDRVYAGHVLEHIDREDIPLVLSEVVRILAPEGRFCVVGPDETRALGFHADDKLLKDIRAGGGRWPGDSHLWTATAENTKELLTPVFDIVKEFEITDGQFMQEWPIVSRVGWQCAFVCKNN